jgi:hypothetical protein
MGCCIFPAGAPPKRRKQRKRSRESRHPTYRNWCIRRGVAKWEKDLFVQKKRLADAERSLQTKETKKARDDVRIATNKIQIHIDRLSDVRRTASEERDTRIFPMTYAPVVANIDGRLQVVPMRYTCRPGGKPANHDVRFPGTYNAFSAFLTVSSRKTTPIQQLINVNFFFWRACGHLTPGRSSVPLALRWAH